jgi:hypothetical protein
VYRFARVLGPKARFNARGRCPLPNVSQKGCFDRTLSISQPGDLVEVDRGETRGMLDRTQQLTEVPVKLRLRKSHIEANELTLKWQDCGHSMNKEPDVDGRLRIEGGDIREWKVLKGLAASETDEEVTPMRLWELTVEEDEFPGETEFLGWYW